MKYNPPKISITRLILTVTIIAGIIIYAFSRLIKEEAKDLTTTHKQTTDTIQPPFDIPEPADQTVKHEACTFKNADIITVMEKIKEWYKVAYAYRKPINNRFTGTIPADLSLDKALRALVTMTSDTIVFLRIGDGQIVINPVGK